MICHAILCYTMLYYTLLYSTLLQCTILLYYTIARIGSYLGLRKEALGCSLKHPSTSQPGPVPELAALRTEPWVPKSVPSALELENPTSKDLKT